MLIGCKWQEESEWTIKRLKQAKKVLVEVLAGGLIMWWENQFDLPPFVGRDGLFMRHHWISCCNLSVLIFHYSLASIPNFNIDWLPFPEVNFDWLLFPVLITFKISDIYIKCFSFQKLIKTVIAFLEFFYMIGALLLLNQKDRKVILNEFKNIFLS